MSNVSSTPRRNYQRLTKSKEHLVNETPVRNTNVDNSIKTPVRTPKRKSASLNTHFYEDVETEFYRVFSDGGKRRKRDDDLSFLFRGACNNIGTSTVGMYGEISHSSLKVVCKKLVEYGLDEKSVVLDLGSGRGVPNFVFAADANTFSSIGVEKCPIAYLNSINNICISICKDIQKIRSKLDFESEVSTTDKNIYNCCKGTPSRTFGSETDCSTASCSSCGDSLSPNANVIKEEEDYEYSVNTQLEPDDQEFNEYSETPSKFLKSPESNIFNTVNATLSGDNNGLDVENQDLKRGLEEFKTKSPSLPLAFVNEDIIAYDSFEGVTHFYSFDIAMERALISNMVYQFKNTSTAYVFASFISDLLTTFDLTGCFLAAKIPCRMAGSGEGKTCYVYVKNDWKDIKKRADSKLLKLFQSKAPKFNSVEKFNVNNYDEPYSSLDMIKLSKMSLYYQYKWYLKRLGKFYKPFTTRSHSSAINVREKLSTERDLLIEQIAHSNSQEPRNRLKEHIQRNFKITSTFP
ncbi:uncharacterized protein TA17620 [Theileria annulata]|uniref:DOT1 domain-containing protein n=1 Tax=Theileria annulata TaxID=5874 RepID=Q4UBB7_THEAN|nr:uncharacterized protein TA17620 [Theileria annulata]CAI75884.1 hypothetical protein TA17620 [Theileria annulata]|eukprot:XP_955360.1 hypothetical protein TA17620 [Theileria annulata]